MTSSSFTRWGERMTNSGVTRDVVSQQFATVVAFGVVFPGLLVLQAGPIACALHIGFSLFLCGLYILLESLDGVTVLSVPPMSSPTAAQMTGDIISRHTRDRLRIMIAVVMCVSVLVYFDGTNIALRARYAQWGDGMLWDEVFIRFDTMCLGWLFPRGQMSLFLDQNLTIGTRSWVAPLYNEVLQLAYVSYYVWGNALALHLCYVYYQHWQMRNKERGKEREMSRDWRRIQMFLSAWIGAFLLNFSINQTFPAVSPRIYLEQEYVTEIHGFLLADAIRNKIKSAAANSFTVFPSGHCGLSWTAAAVAYRLDYIRYARVTAVAAALITLATLVLRYHYFADAIFSPILVVFAMYAGNMSTQAEAEAAQRGTTVAASTAATTATTTTSLSSSSSSLSSTIVNMV